MHSRPQRKRNSKLRVNLYISYGTDTREEQTFQRVTWQQDGVVYQVFTDDDSVTADDLFAAAADALA